jgi:hypothetical protein
MATVIAMVPSAAATTRVGLRFQADKDDTQCRQPQSQAKQISVHQSTSYIVETVSCIEAASIDAATLPADFLTAASFPNRVLQPP